LPQIAIQIMEDKKVQKDFLDEIFDLDDRFAEHGAVSGSKDGLMQAQLDALVLVSHCS
jgi:hypothetical protein